MTTDRISLHTVNSRDALWQPLSMLRRRVFIEEQKVPEHEEWDDADETAQHIAAVITTKTDSIVVGCARLTQQAQIGRMAVDQAYRLRGVGSAILLYTLGLARRQRLDAVFLNAQVHAIGFYRRFGFIETGDEFMDAGIPHKRMELQLY